MFRELRRKKQALSYDECAEILKRANTGILAVQGDNDYPYTVPLNYFFTDNKIYFHCAKEGHKIDSIKRNNKVSFCIIDKDEVHPEKYTTFFKSVIVFGRARILENPKEMRSAIEKLTIKYAPHNDIADIKNAIEKEFSRLCMVEIEIEHISGKEAIELTVQRNKDNQN